MGIDVVGIDLIVGLAVIFVIYKLFFEKDSSAPDNTPSYDEENNQKRMNIITMIHDAKTAKELLKVIYEYYLDDVLSDIFLEKALYLGDNLSEDDWADIYSYTDSDTKLEKVAREKAGDSILNTL